MANDLLLDAPALRGLAGHGLELLDAAAARETFAPGAVLVRENTVSDRVYLLVSGEVSVTVGPGDARDVLSQLRPGAVFASGPVSGRPATATCTAVDEVGVLGWDRAALQAIYAEVPSLEVQLRTRLSLANRSRELVELVKRSVVFRQTSPVLLRWLLESATLAHYAPGEAVCRQGEQGDAMFVVVSGEIEIVQQPPGDGAASPRTIGIAYPGDFFGEISLIQAGPRVASAVASRPSEVLVVSKRAFDVLYQTSAPFRRGVTAVAEERLGAKQEGARGPELVWVVNRTEFRSEAVMGLVAEALTAAYGDRVLLVHAGGARRRGGAGEGRAAEGREVVDAGAGAAARLREIAGRRGLDYVFVTADREHEERLFAEAQELVSSVVYLTPDPARPFPLHVAASKFIHWVHAVETLRRGAEPRPVRRGTLRLVLDASPGTLALRLGGVSERAQRSIGRLGRALTRRVVGLALGGGAAWGYAHCALLRGLEGAGIPVDVMTGVSFGSIVGGVYAARGLEGLDALVRARRALTFWAALAPVTSRTVAIVVRSLGVNHNIEDLEVPFHPVAVNIVTGREEIFRQGPLADAIRASSSLPGLFGPTIPGTAGASGTRFVDGCVASNVPASILVEEGADFVIASNVVCGPKILEQKPERSLLGRIVHELSPLVRAGDAVRALYMMLHDMGARQASCADVTFSPDLMRFLPSDFHRAEEIVRQAEEALPAAIAEIKQGYQARCRRAARA